MRQSQILLHRSSEQAEIRTHFLTCFLEAQTKIYIQHDGTIFSLSSQRVFCSEMGSYIHIDQHLSLRPSYYQKHDTSCLYYARIMNEVHHSMEL